MNDRVSDHVVLVVEHNAHHAQLIKEALEDAAINRQVMVVDDGRQAMSYLHQDGEYAHATRPDLIILDLNGPHKAGRELLSEVKANLKLRRIPIIILATSDDENDIFECYSSQGNCYVIKSGELDQLSGIVKKIKEFWLGIVTLPSE